MWNDVRAQGLMIGATDLILATRDHGTVTEAVTADGRRWFTTGQLWMPR